VTGRKNKREEGKEGEEVSFLLPATRSFGELEIKQTTQGRTLDTERGSTSVDGCQSVLNLNELLKSAKRTRRKEKGTSAPRSLSFISSSFALASSSLFHQAETNKHLSGRTESCEREPV